jgi:hypothetical protein
VAKAPARSAKASAASFSPLPHDGAPRSAPARSTLPKDPIALLESLLERIKAARRA